MPNFSEVGSALSAGLESCCWEVKQDFQGSTVLADVQNAVRACERNSFSGEWAKPLLFAIGMAWDCWDLSPQSQCQTWLSLAHWCLATGSTNCFIFWRAEVLI